MSSCPDYQRGLMDGRSGDWLLPREYYRGFQVGQREYLKSRWELELRGLAPCAICGDS